MIRLLARFRAHEGPISALAFIEKYSCVLTGSTDGMCKIFTFEGFCSRHTAPHLSVPGPTPPHLSPPHPTPPHPTTPHRTTPHRSAPVRIYPHTAYQPLLEPTTQPAHPTYYLNESRYGLPPPCPLWRHNIRHTYSANWRAWTAALRWIAPRCPRGCNTAGPTARPPWPRRGSGRPRYGGTPAGTPVRCGVTGLSPPPPARGDYYDAPEERLPRTPTTPGRPRWPAGPGLRRLRPPGHHSGPPPQSPPGPSSKPPAGEVRRQAPRHRPPPIRRGSAPRPPPGPRGHDPPRTPATMHPPPPRNKGGRIGGDAGP